MHTMYLTPMATLLLGFLTCLQIHQVQATVQFEDKKSIFRYASRPAAFGRPFEPDSRTVSANIFVSPRRDRTLCDGNVDLGFYNGTDVDESRLLALSDNGGNLRYQAGEHHPETRSMRGSRSTTLPIALLVQNGNCTYLAKARNAISLNKRYNFNPPIEYLIVAGSNSRDFIIMDSGGETDAEVDSSIGLLFIHRDSGNHMLSSISRYYSSYKDSGRETYFPHLNQNILLPSTDPNYNGWEIEIEMNGIDEYSDLRKSWRVMLYIFLSVAIAIPLLRFLFVCAVSRRCIIRRNSNGQIRGFRVVERDSPRRRRMARDRNSLMERNREWILNHISNGDLMFMTWNRSERRANGTLTDEEVEKLPKIKYGISDIEAVINEHYENNEKISKENDEEEDGIVKNGNTGLSSNTDSNELNNSSGSDEVTRPIDLDRKSSSFLSTAYDQCTSCSICISDFELGEELILLPKCGHFFHTDCLKPWLKERKGSCPLCQTLVLSPRNDRTSESGEFATRILSWRNQQFEALSRENTTSASTTQIYFSNGSSLRNNRRLSFGSGREDHLESSQELSTIEESGRELERENTITANSERERTIELPTISPIASTENDVQMPLIQETTTMAGANTDNETTAPLSTISPTAAIDNDAQMHVIEDTTETATADTESETTPIENIPDNLALPNISQNEEETNNAGAIPRP